MRGTIAFVGLVAAAMAALTWLLGWWGVALAGAVVGVAFRHEGGGGWRVALAGALAWGALLAADAMQGPAALVASTLAGATGVPAPALAVLTLLFPALLGWSAATVAAATRHLSR